jgi:hypothetical protein
MKPEIFVHFFQPCNGIPLSQEASEVNYNITKHYTHEQVSEASKHTFHPSHNPAPLLAVLYPQFTLEDFVCHLYVNRPAHS